MQEKGRVAHYVLVNVSRVRCVRVHGLRQGSRFLGLYSLVATDEAKRLALFTIVGGICSIEGGARAGIWLCLYLRVLPEPQDFLIAHQLLRDGMRLLLTH